MRNKNLLIVTLVLGLIAFAAVRLTREAPKSEAGKQPLVAATLLEGVRSREEIDRILASRETTRWAAPVNDIVGP